MILASISITILGLISIFLVIYLYFQYRFTYWARKNVEYIKPSFPFGNVADFALQRKSLGVCFKDLYDEFKSRKVPFGGFYAVDRPTLMAIDPEIIKCITTKDFKHFYDRDHFIDDENDPLTEHLVALRGIKWRKLRNKLQPTFTSAKMKMMYQFFLKCSDQLTKCVDKHIQKGESLNVNDILARFTTDIIGNCAFGIDCNSLNDPNTEFRKNGRKIFEGTYRMFFVRMIASTHATLLKLFKVKQINPEVSKFFQSIVHDITEYREKNKVERNDFMNLLIKLRNNESIADEDDDSKVEMDENEEKGLSISEIAAQTFIFFFAGFEPSANSMSFCLFELASNQEIQDKLRTDVLNTLKAHNNELTYDAIMDMTYLHKVVKETLRKYPVVPTINRECVIDYKMPNSDLVVKKGTVVIIPALGVQRDPDNFPDPNKFDPERFSPSNKSARNMYTYLPFGEGPRKCIGLRFGVLQIKVGLASLIKNYKFTLDPQIILPLGIDNVSVFLSSKNIIWLQGTKL